MSEIYKKLLIIQQNLKAPKAQINKFGGFNYRSAEDILEAAKPILHANGVVISINDEIISVGDRIYVKATATVIDSESSESHSVSAMAREAENKKGMDDSQITGTASSYARKYAMNGLFAIDDTKDSDHYDNTATQQVKEPVTKQASKQAPQLISADQVMEIRAAADESGQTIKDLCKLGKVNRLEDLTVDRFAGALAAAKKPAKQSTGA